MVEIANAALMLSLCGRIAAVGVCISSLELLAERAQLGDAGLHNRRGSRLAVVRPRRAAPATLLDLLFAAPSAPALIAIRLPGAALLLLGPTSGAGVTVAAGVVAACSIALRLRLSFGGDGSDTMNILIFSALFLAHAVGGWLVTQACLWFLALQVCLSYLTAGLAKARAPRWRDGTALGGILRTLTYGRPSISRILERRPGLTRHAAWTVIGVECLLPLALVAPPPLTMLFLAIGLAFHLGVAAGMGLNTFPWAFGATYPAVLYCAAMLHGGMSI